MSNLCEKKYTGDGSNEQITPEARLAHAKIYFLVNLWQGVAVGLNVECSKLDNGVKKMHTEFTR